jgi:exoribonuclease-2
MKHKRTSSPLYQLAQEELTRAGFQTEFPEAALTEANRAARQPLEGAADGALRDLRHLPWSSIDNNDSRDLDQIEYVERSGADIRLLIGIADVGQYVTVNSAVDLRARQNTVSIYTPVGMFPMLPRVLSTGATSLLQDNDRAALVIEMLIGKDGQIKQKEVYRALVRNQAQLTYSAVGAWLEGSGPSPAAMVAVSGIDEQIRLQLETAQRLQSLRVENGALEFENVQANPVSSNGQITGMEIERHNSADLIIENFMIAANTQFAAFFEERGIASLRRVVRKPERWPRIVELAAGFGFQLPDQPDSHALADFMRARKRADPAHFPDLSLTVMKLMGPGEYRVEAPGIQQEGHFGLAVHDYTHSTAPNRRYPDLITQRLLKATLAGTDTPYGLEELEQLAEHCTKMEDAARKVERTLRKAAIAMLLQRQIGETFDAIVTGVKSSGVFARLVNPPADGMIVRGGSGVDVGDKITVRLLSVEPEMGFIDLERI